MEDLSQVTTGATLSINSSSAVCEPTGAYRFLLNMILTCGAVRLLCAHCIGADSRTGARPLELHNVCFFIPFSTMKV